MRLLEGSWSELLLLDLLYRQLHHSDTHQLLMVSIIIIDGDCRCELNSSKLCPSGAFLITAVKLEKPGSHIDMQTHTGSVLDNHVTLTFDFMTSFSLHSRHLS